MVLPDPGPPINSVVRPRGKPPPLISSKPAIPVAAFDAEALYRSDFMGGSFPWQCATKPQAFRLSEQATRSAVGVCTLTHVGGGSIGVRGEPYVRPVPNRVPTRPRRRRPAAAP